MQLSICIIAKNEEQNIAPCLECLAPYGFEIIVADTGSTDRTKEIARRYTDKVYDFVWCDDFAAAKNFAVSKAAHPYVMVIDSDEFLEDIDMPRLEQLLTAHPGEVGRIRRRNVFSREGQKRENTEWINRIFAKDAFCYVGRIHEQVTAIYRKEYTTYQAPVVIRHTGYDLPEAERKKKAARNIRLLERELTRLRMEEEQEQIPYILYQLGKSHYMAGDYAVSCDYFSQGLSYDLDPKLEYVIDMVETYGYALLNSGQAETALFFENIYETFGGSADFQFLMGLIYMNNARFDDAVAEFKKATAHTECRNQGVNSYAAYYNIGVIYECLGQIKEAEKYYRRCGGYEPAEKRLNDLRGDFELLAPETIDVIADALAAQTYDIVDVSVLKKGMTNRSYLFSCKGKKYIVRVPGEGTEKLINRRQEAAVYEAIAGKGICDDVLYINSENGYKIAAFHEDVRVCDPLNERDVKCCMDKLRAFHRMKLKVEHDFDLFGQIDFYENLREGTASVYEDYEKTRTEVFCLRKYIEKHACSKVLTHMDAVPDNFLFCIVNGKEELQLTDWEYAGMQDPHVDLAMFAIYSFYDKSQIDRLIAIYFEGNCPDEIRIKIYCYVAVCGLLWSNWCEYKRSLGVEFGEYSLRQYCYAKEYCKIAVDEMRLVSGGNKDACETEK